MRPIPYQVEALIQTPDMYAPETHECIASFKATTKGVPVLLHVCDNGGMQPYVHIREMNRRLEIAQRYLLVMDDDVYFEDNGWLQSLIDALDSDPQIAAAYPYVVRGDITDIPADRPKVRYSCTIGACCTLFRPTPIRLSEEYTHYYADTDYCMRLWDAGYTAVQTDKVVWHGHPTRGKHSHSLKKTDNSFRQFEQTDKTLKARIWAKKEPEIRARVKSMNKKRESQ